MTSIESTTITLYSYDDRAQEMRVDFFDEDGTEIDPCKIIRHITFENIDTILYGLDHAKAKFAGLKLRLEEEEEKKKKKEGATQN